MHESYGIQSISTISNLGYYKIVGVYIQDKKRGSFLLILREDERSIVKIRLGQIHRKMEE